MACISSASASTSTSNSDSASNRELGIIENFLDLHHLLVHKVQNRDSAITRDSTST